LDNIIQILPKEATVSITADSWYGSLRYLLSNKLKHVTLALGGNSDTGDTLNSSLMDSSFMNSEPLNEATLSLLFGKIMN
jgi:hypothetical protein